MGNISQAEFEKIVDGILRDRVSICTHNPIGTEEEILLWMVMSCLVSYLSLSEMEIPCFNGIPDSETYRKAIDFILNGRKSDEFDHSLYLSKLDS